jgi:hypothetical protein
VSLKFCNSLKIVLFMQTHCRTGKTGRAFSFATGAPVTSLTGMRKQVQPPAQQFSLRLFQNPGWVRKAGSMKEAQ